ILAKAGIIPKDYAETMASMIGFRNLLVHDYASINLNLVYEFLQTKLSDLNAFIKYIVEWLERRSPQADQK
ncbi:MAG: HepT-like ribonuclease domain-containing protein, partial [Ignisphaera sp.]